jgi:hypothetical protein
MFSYVSLCFEKVAGDVSRRWVYLADSELSEDGRPMPIVRKLSRKYMENRFMGDIVGGYGTEANVVDDGQVGGDGVFGGENIMKLIETFRCGRRSPMNVDTFSIILKYRVIL